MTGDPVFDDTLKQALAVDLGQSPYLNILSEDRVRQTLREIAALGTQYVIGLNAVNCQTGDSRRVDPNKNKVGVAEYLQWANDEQYAPDETGFYVYPSR